MNKKIRTLLGAAIMILSLVVNATASLAVTADGSGSGSDVVLMSVTSDGVIYDGEGSVEKTLGNGKTATVNLSDCIIDINVAGQKYAYYSTRCVGTAVISDDDLLHLFWLTGEYYVYDLYEEGMYILAGYKSVSGKNIDYYIVTDFSDKNVVKGSSAANSAFHSCIADTQYFYMGGQTGKKRLMTRKQFEDLVDPQPEPTPEPKPVVTPEPKPVVTPEPKTVATPEPKFEIKTPEPAPQVTVKPKEETPTAKPIAKPTLSPAHTFAPLPTLKPIVVPTMRPVADLAVPSVAPNQIVTQFSVEWWWERYIHGEINWEQFWQATFGMNIDTQSHTESTTQTTAEFYWDKYSKGEITWDQLTQLIWGNQWVVSKESTDTEDTYYFYNSDGSLDHTHTEKHGSVVETGEGQGSASIANAGAADVSVSETGKGGVEAESHTSSDTVSHTEVQGTVEAANQGHAEVAVQEVGHGSASGTVVTTVGSDVGKGSSSKGKKKKAKAFWHVTRPQTKSGKGNICLVKNAGIKSKIYSVPSSSKAKFDGIWHKHIKYAGFTAKSRQVLFLTTKGKAIVVKRAKKGSGTWKPRRLKGTWTTVAEGHDTGLALRLVNKNTGKSKCVKNAKAKKVASK